MGQGYRVIGVIFLQNFGILWSTLVLGAFCTYILAGSAYTLMLVQRTYTENQPE